MTPNDDDISLCWVEILRMLWVSKCCWSIKNCKWEFFPLCIVWFNFVVEAYHPTPCSKRLFARQMTVESWAVLLAIARVPSCGLPCRFSKSHKHCKRRETSIDAAEKAMMRVRGWIGGGAANFPLGRETSVTFSLLDSRFLWQAPSGRENHHRYLGERPWPERNREWCWKVCQAPQVTSSLPSPPSATNLDVCTRSMHLE